MGAGVIPFSQKNGDILFLFHRTFSGRRAGCLVDFGGGAEVGESYRQTAMREFIEETETMFFSADPAGVISSRQRISAQLPLVEALFDKTLDKHPDWWCPRVDSARDKPRDWKTFFVEFTYRDVTAMNREWEADAGKRFRKRRELVWIPASVLYDYYRHSPERLWRRVRQLQGATEIIQSIVTVMSGRQAGRADQA